jgi:predicted anti-sigma-YlaC factor YlaD
MKDLWTDKLSDYLDGELSVDERAQIEEHLASCAACSATLTQLRRVVERAQGLADRPPVADLWSGIAERIGVASADVAVSNLEERRRARAFRQKRFSFSLPQLAAVSIVLMVLSGGTAWLTTRSAGPGDESVQVTSRGGAAFVSTTPASATSYDAATVELERILEEGRDQLDSTTVRILEENLMIIDLAIADAQRALAHDPASIYLKEHLAATMRQKLEFLRQAAQMVGAVS